MDDMFDLNDYENAPEVPEKKIEEIEEKKEPELPIVKDEIVNKEEIKEEPKPLIENKIVSNKEVTTKQKIPFAIEDNIPITEYYKIQNLCMKFPFELDDFQKRGVIRVERHENVLVCAHTSSGKTLVAEYAIAKTKSQNKRIIYTSPIKALSNQKFRDFKEKFDDVGVVTGDVSINPDAQCVIMTTEILQNMLYKQSERLKSVDYIIFDEVHYINDRERGHVWEEILILLPNSIGLVMLSATVPNYLQFAQWIGSIKNTTIYIEITYKRVVPLEHKFYINTKNVILFKTADDKVHEEGIIKAVKMANEENERIFKIRAKPQGKKERKEREDKLFHQIKSYNQFLMKREKDKYNEDTGNSNTITQTHLKIEEIVAYVNKQELTPVVVFTFSIKKIDEYAKMLSQNQYISPSESNRIIKFFDKCIAKLSEEDRKIGQIQAIRKLLPSGVGVHHAGLLPILKEIIEILYSKGLIKILFATTSFSIGLNMPTRTVVFTEISKFNEGKKEILSSSEYLQMCGRAGRRGIDDKGNIFILLGDKRNPPNPSEISRMARGGGTSVESKFRLEYKTIIHFFYRNIKNIFDFFKESFIENSTLITMPEIRKKITDMKEKIANSKPIDCTYDIESISDYYSNAKQLKIERGYLFNVPYVNNLLSTKGRVLKWYSKKQMKNIYILLVKYYVEYNGELWCLSVNDDPKVVAEFANKKSKNQFDKYGVINGKFYLYFSIDINDIVDICDCTIKSTAKAKTTQDEDGFDFYIAKDLDPLLTELNAVNKEANAKVVDYLKISRNDIKVHGIVENKNLLNVMQESNNCHNCPLRTEHMKQYEEIKGYKEELEKNEAKLKEENLKCFKEFEARIKVLKALSYLDEENQLLLKGKAAKEISSADCLIVTEFLLSNSISELPIDELIAFLSGFITNQNGIDLTDPEISEGFTKAIGELDKIIKNVKEIEKKENFEESKYNRRFSFSLARPIRSWMKGEHFYQILDECEIEEGKVFTLINRLTLFFDSICEFYKVLGNTTLGEKFVKSKEILLREIMTTKSLYLEEDLDTKNI